MKTLKKYRSDVYGRFTLSIEIDGERKCLDFGGGSRYNNVYSTFITSNPKIQEAIESCSRFNVSIFLVSSDEVKESKDIVKENMNWRDISFSSVKEAAGYLEEKFGAKAYTLTSQAKCIEKGLEYGLRITFDNPTKVVNG